MIAVENCPSSCGVKLLRGETEYKTPEVYFQDLAGRDWAHCGYTQWMYTHSEANYDIGDKIAKYIHDNGLGFVTKSRAGNNPVHGRNITIWVWTRDNEAFERHCQTLLASQKELLKPCQPSTPQVTAVSTKSKVSVNSAMTQLNNGISF